LYSSYSNCGALWLWGEKNVKKIIILVIILMIVKLKKHYPRAYLISGNNLNKIMIPDIESKIQGEKIIKDIEKNFNLKPILKLKKQQN
jgi:hypothetical protein